MQVFNKDQFLFLTSHSSKNNASNVAGKEIVLFIVRTCIGEVHISVYHVENMKTG